MDEQNKSQTPVDSPPDASTAALSTPGQVTPPDISTTPPSAPESPAVSETAPSTPSSTPAPSPSDTSSSSAQTAAPAQSQQKTGKRFSWIIILLVVLFLGFLALVMWYFSTQLKKTAAPIVQSQPAVSSQSKTLVVGTDPTFQPMEFTQNGKIVGYDIDLANLLAKPLNEKVVIKNIAFDNLFTALQQHQIDMIISAVTITPERQKKYAFSEQYLNAGQVIITQKTNTSIASPADLKGKKIGVQQGTTDESEALKYTDDKLVIRYPDFVQATKALVGSNIDAIITDLPSAQGIVSTNPTLKIASDPFTNDYYGIVFRKGDPEVAPINKALDSLRVRGYLTDLKHKWLD